jgi:hypothetical protein
MDRRYVGIDLHRRRSVIYAMNGDGERFFCGQIANEPTRLLPQRRASTEPLTRLEVGGSGADHPLSMTIRSEEPSSCEGGGVSVRAASGRCHPES